MGRTVNTYSSATALTQPSQLIADVCRGFWGGRYLSWQLFRRDLGSEFAGTGLGWLWSFADPIILAGVFVVLRGNNVIGEAHIGMPFAVYVVFGLSLLQAFTEGLTQPLKLLSKSKQLLSQVKVPPEALLGATVLRLMFDSLCYVPILICVMLLYDSWSFFGVIAFVALIPSMTLLGMSISVPLIPFNAIYGDIGRFCGTLNRPLIFLCPTFYRPEQNSGFMAVLNDWNPIAILMNELRSLAVFGKLPSLSFLIVLVISAVLCVVGVLFVRLAVPLLIDRI